MKNNTGEQDIIFSAEDFKKFREWISLNLDSLTWQGRFKDEFEEFWKLFFVDGLSVRQMLDRFEYAFSVIKVGPLVSWFGWLKGKFIAFVFIEKHPSISDLSDCSGIELGQLAFQLRSFFTEFYPIHEEYFSDKFLIGNLASSNIETNYKQIKQDLELEDLRVGGHDDEIMPSLEVTLYDEWPEFLENIKKKLLHSKFNLRRVKEKASLRTYLRIFSDAFIMFLVGAFIVYGTIELNRWYEKYISEKISVYEPQLKWLDNTLTFRNQEESVKPTEGFLLNVDDIENVDNAESYLGESLDEGERYDVESDVVLTSFDMLPKDIDVADLEQSDYEELKKRGYRDSRYGNTKVYRVMMKTDDTERVKKELRNLLDQYGVVRVDNVRPGLSVPGGHYYNLYVPRTRLKEFMAKVSEVDDAIIYESRTTTRQNPVGKNKVFIWVKGI